MKRVLILSDGPVPTPEHTKVEGGGLRCWGLAKGIKQNNPTLDVTIGYSTEHRSSSGFTDNFESIKIVTWELSQISDLIMDYDTIVVSYCMGELSVRVAGAVRADQQLVLDCYVPIYVEVSARGSKQIEAEYTAFEQDVVRWGVVLKRGDIFLCANSAQKDFYKGVLAAVGRINPVTYNKEIVLVVPYGIYRTEPKATNKPITDLIGTKADYMKVLWFGGIYPWFDIRVLADAVLEVNKTTPAKLIVVGAKNPFNTHPDFVNRYEEFMEYISRAKFRDLVIVQEWIDFNERANWYLDSDAVVVVNKEGEENKLAWRTRLVDFMWADLPVLTNGGDPLGELMIENKAAIRMDTSSSTAIARALLGLKYENEELTTEALRANMRELKSEFYWDVATKPLTGLITEGRRAPDLEKMGVFSITPSDSASTRAGIGKIMNKAKKVPAYAKKHGYRATALAVQEMARRKLTSKNVLHERKGNAYVFISHQLDMSGAPFVAIDMATEFKEAGKRVEFYTHLPAHKDNLLKLNKAGISPHVLMNKDMVPGFIPGDTLILNTVAHSEVVKEALFRAAETDQINIIWYLHEDDPELLFRPDEKVRLRRMLEKEQIKLLVPAQKILNNYNKFFGVKDGITLFPYKHVVPQKYHRQLKETDFNEKLRFILPGTMGDGRKGQLPVFYALTQFYENFYKGNESKYRDFELVFVGMSDDFLSRQIRLHESSLMGHFSQHGKVTWLENLDIVQGCNVTICYSIREALPLFVFEGMIAGHVLLRNDSSGMEEQLIEGQNGFYLDSKNFHQVVEVFEEILNKEKTSDSKLADMSKKSYQIASTIETNSYLTCLDKE